MNPTRKAVLVLAMFGISLTATAQESPALYLPVKDIRKGSLSSEPLELFNAGNRLFFSAEDGGGRSLWISDGSDDGTVRATGNGAPVAVPASGFGFFKFSNTVFLAAYVTPGDAEIWRVNDGSTTAQLVTNLNVTGSSEAKSLTLAGSSLYFEAKTNNLARPMLWKFNSPESLPKAVRITNTAGPVVTNASLLTAVGTNLYYIVTGSGPVGLWRAGDFAVSVTNIPATTGFTADSMVFAADRLFLVTKDPDQQSSMHVFFTDAAGNISKYATNLTEYTSYTYLTPVGGLLYFRADNKLWRISLTSLNLLRVPSVEAADNFQPENLTAVGSALYLTGNDKDYNRSLWRVDGDTMTKIRTFSGFGDNTAFAAVDEKLFFAGRGSSLSDLVVWQASGTNEGQNVFQMVAPDGKHITQPKAFIAFRESLYFSGQDPALGQELYVLSEAVPVKLGQLLKRPAGEVTVPVIHDFVMTNQPGGAVWLDQDTWDVKTNCVLFTEPMGSLTIEWGPANRVNYIVTEEPAKDPVAIYHTEGFSEAPLVDVSGIPYEIEIHGNNRISTKRTYTVTNEMPVGSETFVYTTEVTVNGNVWEGNDGKLHADGRTGYIVAHYKSAEAFGGVEIIDVRAYVADTNGFVRVGAEIGPASGTNRADKAASHAFVARGKQDRRTDDGYIYQHADSGPYNGRIYAVRKNLGDEQLANMEVFWMRHGLQGVSWPYEMNRFQSDWPEGQRYLRRPDSLDPRIELPVDLNPCLMPEEQIEQVGKHGYLNANEFYTDGTGKSLLMFEAGPPDRRDWVDFLVVNSLWHTNTQAFVSETNNSYTNYSADIWMIGQEITNVYHQGPRSGYIFEPCGDKYHPAYYGERDRFGMATGYVYAVNKGCLEVWWSNLTFTNKHDHQIDFPGVQWPSYAVIYTNAWPTNATVVNIASQLGTLPLTQVEYPGWSLYYQNDPLQPGFNPNEEHAVIKPPNGSSGSAVFPLRNDLNRTNAVGYTSDPFLLLSYADAANAYPRLKLFQVTLSNLTGNAFAGQLMPTPYPLALMDQCAETHHVSGPGWRDRKQNTWAAAAGAKSLDDTTNIVMRYFYPVLDGFYWPDFYKTAYTNSLSIGAHVPWLDVAANTTGTPINVTFNVTWPPDIPVMELARTLTTAKDGLPEIWSQTSAQVIWMQSTANPAAFGGQPNVELIDPLWLTTSSLAQLPDDVTTLPKGGVLTFPKLPYHLRERFTYNNSGTDKVLQFKGKLIEPASGLPYLLLNVMTERDKAELLKLSKNAVFSNAVENLYNQCSVPRSAPSEGPFEKMALVSGTGNGFGYATLAFNNSTNLNRVSDPISLQVIRVDTNLFAGEIAVIESDNIFDELLTLRHKNDFAGRTGRFVFEWMRGCAKEDGSAPSDLIDPYSMTPSSGLGAVDITINAEKDPPLITLSDNYFVTRYRSCDTNYPTGTNWSPWTKIALAEGWIKRVIRGINPYEQRFTSFTISGDETVNTLLSMMSQAGPPYEGAVALNSESADDAGLLEIYQTVLERGIDMSIDNGYSYGPANDALLLAASRISQLYMLLGNEAYADAEDPTVGFGVDNADYGYAATSVHCFMNQTASLLEEELKLLRGRDDSLLPYVTMSPFYNRLVWNLSSDIAGGEVAYALNYEIYDATGQNGDEDPDGYITEDDAKLLYPQGHGDAWGHYLSGVKGYYRLLQNTNFVWTPRIEAVNIGGQPVNVDYLDERKFAAAAAARARTGVEIANLTYRDRYGEDGARWTGYEDGDHERSWGVADWGRRASQGMYFDWLVANSMLPVTASAVIVTNWVVDPVTGVTNEVPVVSTNAVASGIQKIDRSTVSEIRQIAAAAADVQAEVDKSDFGLSPLGLAENVLPFDIAPSEIDQGKTHFEQIYDRALLALGNASTVFEKAQASSHRLRQQFDKVQDFQRTIREREFDFNNRLIEIFGTPYGDDIGPTGAFSTGYDGPDYIHYNYYDPSMALGSNDFRVVVVTCRVDMVLSDGGLTSSNTPVVFHVANDAYGLVKPPYWTQTRSAVGEIQTVRSDLVQAKARFDRTLLEYDNLLNQIDDQVALLAQQKAVNAEEISILNRAKNQQISLNTQIKRSRAKQQDFRRVGSVAVLVGNALAETLPGGIGATFGFSNGFWVDPFGAGRGGFRQIGSAVNEIMSAKADAESIVELDKQQAKEIVSADQNIQVTALRSDFAVEQQMKQIEQQLRQEAQLRLDLYTQEEVLRQIVGRYSSALSKGERLLEERLRFRQQTAAQLQDYRYKDMAFRIFRDDALQKYRAQFDLAAQYVYLTARAYDYETNFRKGDNRGPGSEFYRQIVRARTIGELNNGVPTTSSFDAGLSDPMARMKLNWSVLEGQLGFNNPQTETGRFSLRSELFRILPGASSDAVWRETLHNHVVDNILDLSEFKRYCLPFYPQQAREPGIVITFSSSIHFGHNFFGWLAGGGDNSYDSANFATKIRSVGVWFANYNNVVGDGMVNTPRVYLVPVGSDVMRSPTDYTGETREWTVVDQALPVPFPLSAADLSDPGWIPKFDSMYGQFSDVRKHGTIRAYHDSGTFTPAETINNSRLIGRSVWNTRWMLIIPAGTLHSDRNEGIARFIEGAKLVNGTRDGNGVKDIKLFFQTYAFEGM